jgi:hypothetical protein
MLWLTLVANAADVESKSYENPGARILDIVRVGDLDQDGYDDVVLRTYGELLWVPGGPFGPEPTSARALRGLGGALLTQFDDVASVGDQNGDGYPDLVLSQTGYPDGGALIVLLGGASGPVTAPERRALGVKARIVRALGDLNGDRITDFGAWTQKGLFVYRGGASRLVHEAFVPMSGSVLDLGTFDDLDGLNQDLLLFGSSGMDHTVSVAARTGTWTWATPLETEVLRPYFVSRRPISRDGKYVVGLMTGWSSGHVWYTGAAGVVASSYRDCTTWMCGADAAVFDTGRSPRVLISTTDGVHVLEATGPADKLLEYTGAMIENAGDIDGDGVADLVSWFSNPPEHQWTFVSGGQLGLW